MAQRAVLRRRRPRPTRPSELDFDQELGGNNNSFRVLGVPPPPPEALLRRPADRAAAGRAPRTRTRDPCAAPEEKVTPHERRAGRLRKDLTRPGHVAPAAAADAQRASILLALIALAVYMALSHNIPIINGKPGERLRADFAFANQVDARADARARRAASPVGSVDEVEAGPDPLRSSRVEMRITDEDLVIHEDARAEIRWRTLLGGNMYIDLEPGSAARAEARRRASSR